MRRTREVFRENAKLQDASKIEKLVDEAAKELQVIRRQVIVQGLYPTQKLVVEKQF